MKPMADKKTRKEYISFSNDDLAKIIKFHNEGYNNTQISKIYKCHHSSISRIVNGSRLSANVSELGLTVDNSKKLKLKSMKRNYDFNDVMDKILASTHAEGEHLLWNTPYTYGRIVNGVEKFYNRTVTISFKGKSVPITDIIYQWYNKIELKKNQTTKSNCGNSLCCSPSHITLINKVKGNRKNTKLSKSKTAEVL
jgi:hypothetical protein